MAKQCRHCVYYDYNGFAGYCAKAHGKKVKIRAWGWAPEWCPLKKEEQKIRKERTKLDDGQGKRY